MYNWKKNNKREMLDMFWSFWSHIKGAKSNAEIRQTYEYAARAYSEESQR